MNFLCMFQYSIKNGNEYCQSLNGFLPLYIAAIEAPMGPTKLAIIVAVVTRIGNNMCKIGSISITKIRKSAFSTHVVAATLNVL